MSASLLQLAADVCERAVRAGAGDAEAYLRHGPVVRVTLQRGVTSQSAGWITNLALRAWRDDRLALATTNDLSPRGVSEAVRKATRADAGVRSEALLPGPAPTAAPSPPGDGDGDADDLGRIEHVEALEQLLRRIPDRLDHDATILSASYTGQRPSTVIVNTRGFRGEYRSERHALWLWMEQGAEHTILGAVGRRFADLDADRLDTTFAERASPSSSAAVPATSCAVLLPPAAAGDLARALGGLLTGDQVVASEALRRRIDKRIASTELTLIDDATMHGGLLSRPFDDEGTQASHTTLIERGVFRSALHTRESAARMDIAPNGKAVRAELWNVPRSAHSNLYFAPGAHAPHELESELDGGLAVSGLLRAGRVQGGAFAIVAEGWWVQGGERVRQVSGVRLSANVFELLRRVVARGEDLRFSPLGHGAGGPSLLVERMDVG